jgi:hypothetical protein
MAIGEVLEPCVGDNVAVGEVPKPCRSTAVGAAGILLMSPCFRRGLRATVVMDARGEPSLPFTETSQMGCWSCSVILKSVIKRIEIISIVVASTIHYM